MGGSWNQFPKVTKDSHIYLTVSQEPFRVMLQIWPKGDGGLGGVMVIKMERRSRHEKMRVNRIWFLITCGRLGQKVSSYMWQVGASWLSLLKV